MRNNLRISKVDNFLFILFAFWLLVDTINGFLLRNDFPISVSQIYKTFVAILVIVRCRNNNQVKSVFIISFVYLFFYVSIVALNGEDVVSSIVLISKLITSLLFFAYFSQICKADYVYFKRKAFFVIKWSSIIFSANMLAGSLGFGFSSYDFSEDEGFGSRGFFYAINELSGVLAVLYAWAIYFCKNLFSFEKYLICCVVLFFLAFTLSTKSGIIATAIFFLYITYSYGNKKEKVFVICALMIIVVSAAVIVQIILSSDIPLFRRISYGVDRYSVLDALTSNRLQYWEEESKDFANADYISRIFGIGGNRTVEMDPFDALLNCGIFGLLVLFYLYFKALFKPISRKYKKLRYNKVIHISNCLLILMSIGGGHILFSSMAGMLIALSNALLPYRRT